ncbi:MAG TPA: TetR family transcriptional regulator [Actinobacteria bacterium]|jgi:AcrR family transcriptional regulator|nr:TetR family transcriptional regulator [Actinomycetota bacterium]
MTSTPDDVAQADAPDEGNVTELLPRARTPRRPEVRERTRMSGQERREQLLDIGRRLFARKGFEAVSVEEIAAKAGVSKPVVYEHFGGKEGLYAVVVDREMGYLLDSIAAALAPTPGDDAVVHPRELLERAGMALFDFIDRDPDGFRILVRDTPVARAPGGGDTASRGTFAGLLVDVAEQVDDLLGGQFKAHGLPTKWAPLYSQMLVGMVAQTGQWWLDVRKPRKEEVVGHLVNLAWNGLQGLETRPRNVRAPRH